MGMGSPGFGVGSLTLGTGFSCGRAGSTAGSLAGVSGFGVCLSNELSGIFVVSFGFFSLIGSILS
jgi:hypothetical protein